MEKVGIIVDTREHDKAFLDYLVRFGAIIDKQLLPFGDIIIMGGEKTYIFEHKSVNDLGNSISDGRFFEQIKGLVESCEINGSECIPCLLIVGDYWKLWKKRRFTDFQIAGILNAVQDGWGVQIFYAHNNRFAAIRLTSLAKRIQNQEDKSKIQPMRFVTRKKMTKGEEGRYVIEGFPALGPVRAQMILEYYGTVGVALQAMQEGSINNIDGIGPKIAQAVKVVFNYEIEMDE